MRSAALLFAAALLVPAAGAVEGRREVTYRDDAITVHLEGVPVTEVIAEIARQSGASVRGEVREPRDVTLVLERTPTKEALQRLLGAQNFALVYGEDGALKEIALKGGPEEGAAGGTGPGGVDTERARAAREELYRLFDIRDQIPLDGRLRQAVGRDEAGFDYVANTAIGADDPKVRREAVRAALKRIEADPELRAGLLARARTMSDAEFADWARATCYHRAEDLVKNIARASTIPEIRTRARGVLRELDRIPFTGPIPHELSKPREG